MPHSLADRIARWLLDHPRSVAALLLTMVGLSLGALPFLKVEAGLEPFFDRTRPEQKVLDRVQAHFVSDSLLYIAYRAPDVFSKKGLESIRQLGVTLETLPGVEKVTSLTTVKDLVGEDLSFSTTALVPDPIPDEPGALAHIGQRARANALIRDGLLSEKDDTVAAMIVRLKADLSDEQSAEAVASVRQALTTVAGLKFWVTGEPATNADTAQFMRADLAVFIPASYLIIVVLLFLFLRRVTGVALALVSVTISLFLGLGVLSLIGGTMNNLSTMLPPVMMVLAVANIIHFLSELAKNAREHGEAGAARLTMSELLLPSFMCALTTAVGFGSLSVSSIPAMVDFGLAATVAVMLSFVTSFLLVSLASRWRPATSFVAPESAALSERLARWTSRYADLVVRRPWALLAITLVMFGALTWGATRIVVDENTLERFDPDTPIRQSADFIEQTMGGTTVITLSIKANEADRFLEPEALHRLESLDAFLRREVGADHVTSMVDYVKLMHRSFLGESPSEYRIPDTRQQVAQLVALNGDDTFREFVDADRQWVRLLVRTNEHHAAKLQVLYEKIDTYLAQHFPEAEGYQTHSTGQARLWVLTMASIIGSQTNSLGLAFVLIFGPIFLLFRSVRAGLFSIPSNLFPIGLSLGVMGWLDIPLNTSTTMIASVVLGIAVDDTIHFIECLRSRLARHGNLERALREALQTKAAGVLWTAFILTLGFSVLGFSRFAPTRYFGGLTGFAMISGVLGEMLLLPALLLVTRTKLGVESTPEVAAEAAQEA